MVSAKPNIIASAQSWIEGEAVRQLERAAGLPGVRAAVGMPDLHPGKGYPIGAAIVTEGMLYPYLVGTDIGCGMGLWLTSLETRKIKIDRATKRLCGLEGPWDGDVGEWLGQNEVAPSGWDTALGTIGGGNHFAELQCVKNVVDAERFAEIGLAEDTALLLVHSGSRGLGESILRSYVEKRGAAGVEDDSEDAAAYLERHDHAVRWAGANRALIAHRFLTALGTEGRRVLDLVHNSIAKTHFEGGTFWLHRKGAAPSDQGPVVIPGSRATLTYLVAPVGVHEANAFSVAHGAGRKWNRTSARERGRARYTATQLTQTKIGGRVICDDKDLLFEEAPEAYKNVDTVVKDLEDAGLVKVVATFSPLITYKVRHEED